MYGRKPKFVQRGNRQIFSVLFLFDGRRRRRLFDGRRVQDDLFQHHRMQTHSIDVQRRHQTKTQSALSRSDRERHRRVQHFVEENHRRRSVEIQTLFRTDRIRREIDPNHHVKHLCRMHATHRCVCSDANVRQHTNERSFQRLFGQSSKDHECTRHSLLTCSVRRNERKHSHYSRL